MTQKQQRFVEEYLVDLNGTQAAIRAGYSPRSAAVTAVKNLRNPVIGAAVRAAKKLRSERVEITADGVLNELAVLASADPHDLGTWNEHGARAKLGDKIRALELLGRHLSLWDKKGPHVDIEILEGPELAQSLREQFERVVEAEAHPLPPEKPTTLRPETRKKLPARILIPRRVPKSPE